jgi:hypothetical protein
MVGLRNKKHPVCAFAIQGVNTEAFRGEEISIRSGMQMRTLALAVVAVCLFAAQKPATQVSDKSCHLGSVHRCKCPRMVARHNATLDTPSIVEGCKPPMTGQSQQALADKERFRSCLIANGVLSDCEIISRFDSKHPEDSCKAACKTDTCRCSDGPPCTHFTFDIDKPPREGDYGSTDTP